MARVAVKGGKVRGGGGSGPGKSKHTSQFLQGLPPWAMGDIVKTFSDTLVRPKKKSKKHSKTTQRELRRSP